MDKKKVPIAEIEQDCYVLRGEIMCPQKKETGAVAKQVTTAKTVQPDGLTQISKKEIGGIDPLLVTVLFLSLIPFKLLFIGWLVLRVVTKITNKF